MVQQKAQSTTGKSKSSKSKSKTKSKSMRDLKLYSRNNDLEAYDATTKAAQDFDEDNERQYTVAKKTKLKSKQPRSQKILPREYD